MPQIVKYFARIFRMRNKNSSKPRNGKSFIKENCHNSKTNDDNDMKLGPVTKLDKRNKATSKNMDHVGQL